MVASRRLFLAVLMISAVLGLVSGVVAVVLVRMDDSFADIAFEAPPAEPEAVRVLRAWDARRARAFTRADGAALAELYVPGSRTGAADRAMLRDYRQRGLRVTGMRTQVLSATVLRESERRIVLLVTDVLVEAVATDGDRRHWPLPRDRPSTRRVVLVSTGGRWRVAEAYTVD